ncbi:MAG: EamA family transporter, partial [Pseudomonadota bacterium]
LARHPTMFSTPATSHFYTGLLGTLALLPFGIMAWETPPSLLAWGLTFGIGAIAWAGHEFLIRAHAYAEASLLAPFGYVFVLYLAFAGWLVFDHIPEWYVGVGAVLIFAAGLIIWRSQRN